MKLPARRLDPRIRTEWWTVGAIVTVVVGAGATTAAILVDAPLAAPAGLAAAVAAVAVVAPPLLYRRWRYEIRERDLFVARGYLFAVHTLVPFDRIQYVENRQGPLDRTFDLTKLIVYTAAGKSALVPGLGLDEAESIREELSRVAGTFSV